MRKYIIFPIITLILILSGCTNASIEASEKILPPKITTAPLQGKWIIDKAFNKDFKTITNKYSAPFIGKIAEFTKDGIMVGNFFWSNPEYKIKEIKSDEYFVLKYQKPPEKLGIKNMEITVVTVTSLERFIYEFAKINENECLADIDGCIYFLRKTSDQVDADFTKKISRENVPDNSLDIEKSSKIPITGVFIGLKSPQNNYKNTIDYSYRTIFIESINKSVKPIVQTENIFFPRKSGFWKLQIKKATSANRSEDMILAYDASAGISLNINNTSEDDSIWKNRIGNISRSLLSVCNDYISVESTGFGTYNNKPGFWSENRLQLLPVDSISKLRGLSIEDAAGITGLNALNEGRQNYINSLKSPEINQLDTDLQDENFALTRKTGHWFFKGRLNYIQSSQVHSEDFNVNLMPSSKIVLYDTLFIPWTAIKDKVPEAVDAYTSPNKDIALIVTAKYILVYTIENGALSNTPVKKLKLENGETVIMSEWATGDYVYNWEKNFYKNPIKQAE